MWAGVGVLAALLVALAGGAAFIAGGFYDISVTAQHTQPVYTLLETTMARAVRRHARDIEVPPLGAAAQVQRGAACYRDKCLQCHGGPGVAQGEIGLSMQPLPGPLVDAAKKWQAHELYLITRDGVKMSGMPAWRYRLSDADLWAVVAFVQRLPQLGPREFKASLAADPASCAGPPVDDMARSVPDAGRGKLALHQHACTSCHIIPGLSGPRVHVGPPLAGIARRQRIAGNLPNTPEQMVRWIRNPHSVDAESAMPVLGVSEASARDMAAYLATLR
jgi:cytochrome c1